MNRSRITIITGKSSFILSVLSLVASLCGCTTESQARRLLESGNPLAAVRLYEQALADRPGDPGLQQGLARARTEAADVLATRAEVALTRHRSQEAVRLAQQAAGLEASYRPLEARARHQWAGRLLTEAGESLDERQFDEARRRAEQAQTVAGDLPESSVLLQRIAAAEAAALADDARTFAEVGQFDQALRLARRAADLRPSDDELADLSAHIGRKQRETIFDRLAAKIRADLEAKRLADMPIRLGELASLEVQSDKLAALRQTYREKEDAIEALLAEARSARIAGRFEDALGHFTTAEGLVADRPEIAEEKAGCEIDRRVADLLRDGRLAFQQGDYDQASRTLSDAFGLRANAQTTGWLNQARAALHRQAYEQALEAGNVLDAVENLQAMLRYEADETAAARLAPLKQQLVDAMIAEASQLYADDRIDQAVARLDAALAYATDERLIHLRADLVAEGLFRSAVRAEQAGDYRLARSLYLEAMAAGGDRQAVANRIDDIQVLVEMQKIVEQSQGANRR
jgi:tetratricopeptide (TPR) repeat protein